MLLLSRSLIYNSKYFSIQIQKHLPKKSTDVSTFDVSFLVAFYSLLHLLANYCSDVVYLARTLVQCHKLCSVYQVFFRWKHLVHQECKICIS